MERRDIYFELNFSRYLRLLEHAVINPNLYSENLKNLDFKKAYFLFCINASGWLVLSALIRTFLIQKYLLFFAILSETLILLVPLFILLVIFAVFLHILARMFGSRTKLRNNIKAVLFSSILLPFFAVPVFKVLAMIISLFIMIYCFKAVNRFDKIRASISVIIPAGIIFAGLFAIGIINVNLITR